MGKITVHEGKKSIDLKTSEDINLLMLLNRNGFLVSNPCGGNGTCGKCRVRGNRINQDISAEEAKLLGEKSIEDGYRLACFIKPSDNMEVYLEQTGQKAVIVTQSVTAVKDLNQYITKKCIKLKELEEDSRESDEDRLLRSLNEDYDDLDLNVLNLNLLRKLPYIFSGEGSRATLVYYKHILIDIEPDDTKNLIYGIGMDIGTTTVAAYLVNLITGSTDGVFSSLNPQKAFGDDVISRINYTMENAEGRVELKDKIINCINDAVNTLSKEAGINKSNIYSVNIAGNTTMLHMAMGLDCRRLALSPFISVTTATHTFTAGELGIEINPYGMVSFLPGISAYVGADTLCAVLASDMYRSNSIELLVDIGTNGEIVLGSNENMYSCSVAAGPAFEGAHLKNGIGGITGAIDKVFLTKDIEYTTIGSGSPVGICGSGILDAIAQLLNKGIIDATGRFLDEDELPRGLEPVLKNHITEVDGMKAFALYLCDDKDKNIYVTQKDIREIQNAKAAIAAGIRTLIKNADIDIGTIEKVYLAGGFGSFINIDSALKIGLLPKELSGKVVAIGNAAGAGAVQSLISLRSFEELEIIKKKINYIELSGNNDFTDLYIGSMMLE